ncbi:MAG: lysophospholipid acyltransferase family protein [Chloroflexi bacterium]|nr:lysophospholipid acyltransferase family protein [Chloroflexota bacterium]
MDSFYLKTTLCRRQPFWFRRVGVDLSHCGMRLAAMIARWVPLRLGYLLAGLGGDALFLFAVRHRNVVHNNLKRVLDAGPDRGRRQRAARGVFRTVAKNYFDLTRLAQFSPDYLEKNVKVEGWPHLMEAVTGARGTIIATAHLGNFEFAAQVLALRGIEMTIFVEAFDSTPFLRNIAGLRRTGKFRILPVGIGPMREAVQLLRRGGTVTVVCDRDIRGNGLKVKFFGEETTLPPGVVSLALRTGATIVPVFSLRESGNRSRIFIEPPLRLVDDGDRGRSLRTNLESLAAVVEKYVRRYPEQWAVIEPIWRSGAN